MQSIKRKKAAKRAKKAEILLNAYEEEYTEALKKGGFHAFLWDLKCFFGSIVSVFKSDGVVEGGTGEINKEKAELE